MSKSIYLFLIGIFLMNEYEQEMQELVNTAKAEGREMTKEEGDRYLKLFAMSAYAHGQDDIRHANGVAQAKDRLTAAQNRKAGFEAEAREEIEMETREDKTPEVVQVREPEGREIEFSAPVEEHYATARTVKAEYDKPMPDGASFADLLGVTASQRGLSLGKHIRGIITGDWRGAEQERAMSGATAGAGGALLPVVYSSEIIDLARNKTQVLNAGARIVPMSARQVIMPMWTSDPSVAFRLENGNVATSDASVDTVTFTARSLSGYTTLSREIIEDTDLSGLLSNAYATAVAAAWDTAALYGTGVDPNPLGLKANTDVTDNSALATNGASLTYDHLIDAVGAVRGRNETPGAVVYHPRNELALGKLKDSNNNYLAAPAYLDGVKRLTTGAIPVNETEGTANGICNTLFVGDFSQLFIGMRTSFGLDVHTSPAATTGQVLMVAWMRMDVQIGRPGAFAVRTGVLA